ncbi:S-layer homology domain-containing protein [Succinispira mobilis]|uniref:S-layer homology domain-containing protein n=1 Tax=Succinispira mobilis TaxID=78120 RepID=UPI001FE030D5|nr:S-layer homology domain-containing protein [Succinispira mobilis]
MFLLIGENKPSKKQIWREIIMKKSLVLAMALSLGIAGTAFAANPFSDVPSNHWAYASVSKLAQAGIVEGYGDDTFKGGKSITRYEMAQMVAKAMAKSDKADASQKAMIEKLAAEFSAELDNLGVRVTKLEKNADNVKITGEMRFRYRGFDGDQYGNDKQNETKLRTRLNLKGEINDKWTANMMLENEQNLETNGRADEDSTLMRRAWVAGSIDDVKVQAGRFAYADVNAFLFDSAETDGVRLDFGNKLKATVLYGRMTPNKYGAFKSGAQKDVDTAGLALDYKQDKWQFNAAYYDVKGKNDNAITGVDDTSFGQFYAAYKFDKNFKLAAQLLMAGDEVNGTDKTGYTARLDYKGMNVADKGSWGAWIMGFDAPAGVLYAPAGLDWDLNDNRGVTGYEIGFNYAVQKNIKLQVSYSDLEQKEAAAGMSKEDQQTTTAFVQFFF